MLGLDLGQRTKLQHRRPPRPLCTEGASKKTPRQLLYSAVKSRMTRLYCKAKRTTTPPEESVRGYPAEVFGSLRR